MPKAEQARPWRPWYGLDRWRKRRAMQLQSDPLCRICRETFNRLTPASIADHVIPHRGDAELFWYGELQSLCKPCHDGIKASIEKGGSPRLGCDRDGVPHGTSHWS